MKMNNLEVKPGIKLKDGNLAYHSTYSTNSGYFYHRISFPRKLRKEELDLSEEDFAVWLAEHAE